MLDLQKPYEFDWDQGNVIKNLVKHAVECREAEEVFLDDNMLVSEDISHSLTEKRYQLIGKNFSDLLSFPF